KLPVCYDDDDDEESSNSLEDNIISELPPAKPPDGKTGTLNIKMIGSSGLQRFFRYAMFIYSIYVIPCLYIRSLCVMLSRISFHVLYVSESEDLSDSKCDVPACDNFTTFSNLLFDADDDFSSSDNESFCDEDISKEIYSNPLFDEEIISMKIDPHHFNVMSDLIESLLNHDSSIISSSSKIDSLLDEFAGELTLLKSSPPRIYETDCDPEEEIHPIEKLLYDNSSPYPSEEFIFENSNAAIESLHFLSPLRIVTLLWMRSIYLLL
nr:hypothetical protein [Tanacetum cinerariifolium]